MTHRRSQSKGGPARPPCSPGSFPPLQLPSWANASMPDPETAGLPRAWAGPLPTPQLDQASPSTLRVPPSTSVLFPNTAQPSPLTSLQLCPLESTHPPVQRLGSLARGRALPPPANPRRPLARATVTAGLDLPGARHWPPPRPTRAPAPLSSISAQQQEWSLQSPSSSDSKRKGWF